ncbi:MAG: pyrophosphatase [Aureispira sp.]|nr:pyrophosphatase [Aureispira sp.]
MCDIDQYSEFVDNMLSSTSKNLNELVGRLETLHSVENCNIPGMITGATGLVCESAELKDIVKKVLFQGKDLSPEVLQHMKKELGDVIFYFVVMCKAIGTTPGKVIELNREKLNTRFASGKFSVAESEMRKKGDV